MCKTVEKRRWCEILIDSEKNKKKTANKICAVSFSVKCSAFGKWRRASGKMENMSENEENE